ncbi:DUF2007 domain-containing protein [Vibrio clamense]|uniref:DUF2007 domain-containing protein n=1 Tax=Vibrio clamense TaxID=2910254 RepID=UPI003D1E75FA
MKAFIASTPTEAHIVCEWLKSERIDCEVRGEGLFGLRGELPLNNDTDAYIWLHNPEQALKAKAIIDDYQQQCSSHQQHSWHCQHCNNENEPQFGVCWSCSHSRDI